MVRYTQVTPMCPIIPLTEFAEDNSILMKKMRRGFLNGPAGAAKEEEKIQQRASDSPNIQSDTSADEDKQVEVAPLFEQAKKGNWENFKEKIDKLEDAYIGLDGHGETFLHWAAANNNVEIMEYLVDVKKCYINQVNFYHATPLLYAAMNDADEAITFLISRWADPRQASAFSGKRPAEACTQGTDLHTKLANYTSLFERRLLTRPRPCFQYRMADHWRTSMQALRHPNGKRFYSGYPIHPMATVHFRRPDGPKILIEICKEMDSRYEAYLRLAEGDDGSHLEHQNACIVCESSTRAKCSYCGLVALCEECQRNCDLIVKQMREIHTNNCRTGKFS